MNVGSRRAYLHTSGQIIVGARPSPGRAEMTTRPSGKEYVTVSSGLRVILTSGRYCTVFVMFSATQGVPVLSTPRSNSVFVVVYVTAPSGLRDDLVFVAPDGTGTAKH